MRFIGRIVVGAVACMLIRWGAYDHLPWMADFAACLCGILLLGWTEKDRAR